MPDLEPVEAEFATTAKHIVKVERIVDATPAAIWGAITETAGWTQWFPKMTRAESVSQQATLGSTRTIKIGALVAEERIVLAKENEAWAFAVTRTNLPLAKRMLEMLQLEDVSTPEHTRTRVSYTGAFEPLWFNRLMFRLVKRNVATTWRHGLDGLASHVASA
ncbi:MAG: SRPBCC family protein [Actinomycetota bacterium]|nr:SRPBCC family protein [Actinomycetota bacterium]